MDLLSQSTLMSDIQDAYGKAYGPSSKQTHPIVIEVFGYFNNNDLFAEADWKSEDNKGRRGWVRFPGAKEIAYFTCRSDQLLCHYYFSERDRDLALQLKLKFG